MNNTTTQGDTAGFDARLDAAGYGTLRNGSSVPQRYCVCCCERVATTTSEGGDPSCEPCARDEVQRILRFQGAI
ncbi:hypothetical protein LCGC14_1203990 [marine sediment metagenome]|uniref:Uncharacterized protein n=1 Tax=marine sediment metagenome TaxID=412755 RepID=A0A0F9NYF0_9ZZZZ